jgi:signal transduction histidine kinase
LSVTDTGRGIPPDHLERVFEPFFSTKVEGQGTGLGLSIVRNILVNHGAEVSVRSEVGRGTTFFVELDAS